MRAKPLLAVALVCLLAHPCAAIWSHDPTENNPLCVDPAVQGHPAIAGDGLGGAIVVWVDERGDHNQIYGQRITGAGEIVWEPGGAPVCTYATNQSCPRVVSDGAGGAIATWMDWRAGELRVYAERVNEAGVSLWNPLGVAVCTEECGQYNQEMVSDGQQGAIIVWSDDRSGEYDWDVYAQRLHSTGEHGWPLEGLGVSTAPGLQSYFCVCEDGQGGVIVAWSDDSAGQDSADIYVQRVTADGLAWWSIPDGVPVTTAAGRQALSGIAADGTGGCVVVWQEERAGDYDVYAQRVDSGGTPRWATDGIAVASDPEDQCWPVVVGDGAGGAIILWRDDAPDPTDIEIHAQHVDIWGQEVWTAGGVPVCVTPTYKGSIGATSDGAGGVIVEWEELRLTVTDQDLYAQRIDSSGALLWGTDGTPICTREDMQVELGLVGDGAGGAVFAWRHGDPEWPEGDIYAQRIERNGYLGYPSPQIVQVIDYPGDQGGVAVVSWMPSYLDAFPYEIVTEYSVWRQMPWEEGRALPERSATASAGPDGLAAEVIEALARSGWSYVGSVPASYWTDYGYDAPTYGDSTAAGGIEWTLYMVVAQTDDQWVFWGSQPLPGYSVDNLAPGAPLALGAEAVEADVELTWSASGHHDEDLAVYNVYRSDVPGFAPDETTFLDATVDTSYVDVEPGGGVWYYVVAGEDVHGNEGPPSNEASAEAWTGVDDPEIPLAFALRWNEPNPFASATRIAFDVPAGGGRVRIEVYDVSGRLVRVLSDGYESPGRKVVAWDGADGAGVPAASGVYFCRMESEAFEAQKKLILLR